MTCIDNQQWKTAQLACNAKLAGVKGLGFGYKRTGIAGLRDLGALQFSVTPASVVNFASGNAPLVSSGSPAPAPAPLPPTLNINTAPSTVIDPNDPCSVASQMPCPGPDTCSGGLVRTCEKVPRQANNGAWGTVSICYCAPPPYASAIPSHAPSTYVPAPPPADTTYAPPVQANLAAGGFSHWGLLAAVAVGGGALYLVMRKKKPA